VNVRVIARDWRGMALGLIAKKVGPRVVYLTAGGVSTEPVGFPREDVFAYMEGLEGRRLSVAEWSKLNPFQVPSEGR
jgi:hypothetical protein